MIDAAITGLFGILQWKSFLLMMVGIVISSTLVAMPGIGSKTAIALLLPVAFVLNKFEAICLIMSVWAVSNTANSITSILFSVPGGGGSQATIMDGYPMAKNVRQLVLLLPLSPPQQLAVSLAPWYFCSLFRF